MVCQFINFHCSRKHHGLSTRFYTREFHAWPTPVARKSRRLQSCVTTTTTKKEKKGQDQRMGRDVLLLIRITIPTVSTVHLCASYRQEKRDLQYHGTDAPAPDPTASAKTRRAERPVKYMRFSLTISLFILFPCPTPVSLFLLHSPLPIVHRPASI